MLLPLEEADVQIFGTIVGQNPEKHALCGNLLPCDVSLPPDNASPSREELSLGASILLEPPCAKHQGDCFLCIGSGMALLLEDMLLRWTT